jgi:hypothetical protein
MKNYELLLKFVEKRQLARAQVQPVLIVDQ